MGVNEVFWRASSGHVSQPVDLGAPISIAKAKKFAEEARDDTFYKKLFQLQLVMSGMTQTLDQLEQGGWVSGEGGDDLPYYPDIDPDLGPEGVQNHLLVNSRINIQSVVYSNPKVVASSTIPLIRDVIDAWIHDIWDETDFQYKAYEVGLDCETMGMGFVEIGTKDGGIDFQTFSPLDALWDRKNKHAADWRFFIIRRWLSIDEAYAKFKGQIPYSYLESLATPMILGRRGLKGRRGEMLLIPEYSFWHPTSHAIFLGGIKTSKSVVLRINDQAMEYEVVPEGESNCGANPFGIIPVAVWCDSMSPGVRRHVGKAETTVRSSSLVNRIEKALRAILVNGAPINLVNMELLDPKEAERLKDAKDLDNVGSLVAVSDAEAATNAVHRIPADDLPGGLLQLRALAMDELKGASGVMDSMRGLYSQGERTTAQEIRVVESNGGIQNRHTRKRYRDFLHQCIRIMMRLAKFDTKDRLLTIGDTAFNTTMFPVAAFMSMKYPVSVQEDSLAMKSDDERRQDRMLEFSTVDIPLMQAGVADPMRVALDVYKDLGEREPTARLYSAEEMAMRQQSALASQGQNGKSEPDQSASN